MDCMVKYLPTHLSHYVCKYQLFLHDPYNVQAIESVDVINTVTSILTGNMTYTLVREVSLFEYTSFYNAYPHTATQSTYPPYRLC